MSVYIKNIYYKYKWNKKNHHTVRFNKKNTHTEIKNRTLYIFIFSIHFINNKV